MYFVIIFYGLLLILVIRFFYIHAKYPFWSHMPVYHSYDLFTKDHAYIQQFPLRNKYTNPLLIKTLPFLDLNDAYLKYFAELLQIGYTKDDSILCTLEQKNIRAFMTGHNGPALVSFYCAPIYKTVKESSIPSKGNEVSRLGASAKGTDSSRPGACAVQVDLEPEPLACAASYSVNMQLTCDNNVPLMKVPLNYITYVSREQSSQPKKDFNKHILEVVATHDYNARRLNLDYNASLIKSSSLPINNTCPLIQFETKTFKRRDHKAVETTSLSLNTLDSATSSPMPLKVKEIVQIYKQNWSFALDLLGELHRLYSLVIAIDIGAIRARIEGEEWFVYAYVNKGQTMAMYFIENAHMLYENDNVKTLRLVASVNNGLSVTQFNAGFQDCLRRIVKGTSSVKGPLVKGNLDYKQVIIDCIGSNQSIMLGQPIETELNSYCLINWTNKTEVPSESAFILV
jgi:hypothetical protein